MRRSGRLFGLSIAAMVAIVAVAVAAPFKGKTYTGKTALKGTSQGKPIMLSVTRQIKLTVSRNGKSVKVSLPGDYPLWYCNDNPGYTGKQTTKPATIKKGSFAATVTEGVAAYHGKLLQHVTGHFTGGVVKGTIKTAGACGGSTTYTATAPVG